MASPRSTPRFASRSDGSLERYAEELFDVSVASLNVEVPRKSLSAGLKVQRGQPWNQRAEQRDFSA